MVDSSVRFLEGQRERAHERAKKTADVNAIFHFLGEDVTGVALAGNMESLGNFVLNPFTDFGFMDFDMATPLVLRLRAQ